MNANLLVIHGGAPTAVINASLYGVIMEAKLSGAVGEIYGAKGGAKGLMCNDFLPLHTIPEDKLRLLLYTPSSVIGTSRDHLEPEDYESMAAVIRKRNIGYVLYNGGNGSMEACGKLAQACGDGVKVVGIPKTIDNDIAVTDHAPGFGSAARYLASTVREVAADVRSLPIHVSVVEAMGRNAGWLAAASALARTKSNDPPHMILMPETTFDKARFLAGIERLFKQHGGVVVVASEGLIGADGSPIVPPVFQTDRSVYYGDVSAHLAGLIIRELGIKARSEKPGICGRSSIACQSDIDREEAELAGREAVRAAVSGKTRIMIGFERIPGDTYAVRTVHIPIEQVMLHERTLPSCYIDGEIDVTEEYIRWVRPLVGNFAQHFRFQEEL